MCSALLYSSGRFRSLSQLKWQHVNPYGTFTLNIHERLPLEQWRNSLALLCRNLKGRYLMALKEVEAGNGPELS